MSNDNPKSRYTQKLEEAKRIFYESLGSGDTIPDFERGFRAGWWARGDTYADPIAVSNQEQSKYFETHPWQDDAGYGPETEEKNDDDDASR